MMTETEKKRAIENTHKISDLFRKDVESALLNVIDVIVERNPAAIDCIQDLQVFALTVVTDLYSKGKIAIKGEEKDGI